MIKKLLILLGVFVVAACSSVRYDYLCPNVIIPRDTAYSTQIADYSDNFQVELKGYEGYCYYDSGRRTNYAAITPAFTVRRLKDTPDTAVDVSFYTETVKGPPAYIGRKTYYTSTVIGENDRTRDFMGQTVKVKLPPEGVDEFEILLGIDLSHAEYRYNQRTFDVTPRFNIEKDPLYIERVRIKEEKPAETSSCGSCKL